MDIKKSICGELNRQGLVPERLWTIDQRVSEQNFIERPEVMDGYYCWSQYIVWLMSRSQIVTYMVLPIALKSMKNMANEDRTWFGNFANEQLIKLCWLIGTVRKRMRK
jgi:hypothetical protein